MPFTIFQKFTTVSADEINDNFYHVGQGDLIPKGGTSLADTTSVYDLGSSDYRWNNLYCNNINIDGSITTQSKSLWTLEAEVNVTATASTITISGLNGDSAECYKIIGNISSPQTTSTHVYLMYINSDSAASYGYQSIQGANIIASSERYVSGTSIEITRAANDGNTISTIALSDILIYSKSGNERLLILNQLKYGIDTYIGGIAEIAYIWDNTSSTITSIVFGANVSNAYNPGTHIEIWKRG